VFFVFDLDGTLIDGYEGITDALDFAMERVGRAPLAVEQVRGMVGEGLERLIEKAIGRDLVSRTRLMPDVPAVLEALAADGHAMSVASNKPADFSRRILSSKGIAGYFTSVCGPGPGVPAKPHPEMLRRMMHAAARTPRETVVVGDMEIDAEFARAGGCHAVLVAGGSRSREELAEVPADAHLSRLSELSDWVDRIIPRSPGSS
jgi:phosphoglycolate phosphatase